jgi:hypothetical protein
MLASVSQRSQIRIQALYPAEKKPKYLYHYGAAVYISLFIRLPKRSGTQDQIQGTRFIRYLIIVSDKRKGTHGSVVD